MTDVIENVAPECASPIVVPPAAADERVTKRIAERTHDLECSVRSYYKCIEEKREQIARLPEKVPAAFAVFDALKAAGFDPRMGHWTESVYLQIERRQLVDLAYVLGPMEETGRQLEDAPPRAKGERFKPMVRVHLRSVRYDFVEAFYVMRLPKGAKCHVETKIEKRRELVCDLNPTKE